MVMNEDFAAALRKAMAQEAEAMGLSAVERAYYGYTMDKDYGISCLYQSLTELISAGENVAAVSLLKDFTNLVGLAPDLNAAIALAGQLGGNDE